MDRWIIHSHTEKVSPINHLIMPVDLTPHPSWLCRIIDNVRGELGRRQWIIFDGDVDPDWVENLNSVLDDNKLLTLPNGERLSLPSNVMSLCCCYSAF